MGDGHHQGAPGIDGVTIADIEVGGVESARAFLDELGRSASSRSYGPKPLWRVNIRKPGKAGEIRTLGIPTIADPVIMTAAEIVVEPIFEADFHPVSFGSRPKRSAHDEPRPVPTREHHNVQGPRRPSRQGPTKRPSIERGWNHSR
ncbi:MAG: hypothetical protein M3N15_07700 [Actinomycetota bacterium]|nr:hypothetical protein [Actinomycetota bacterium]